MSCDMIDVRWRLRVADNEIIQWVDLPFYPGYKSIFHDSDDIIRAYTGLEWKINQDNGYVKDIIPALKQGVQKLDEEKKYEEIKRFLYDLIQSWDTMCKHPWNKQYKDILHFWIG